MIFDGVFYDMLKTENDSTGYRYFIVNKKTGENATIRIDKMSLHLSTKERMLLIIDDMEMVTKELLENIAAPKHQKMSPTEHAAVVDLLLSKDEELRKMLRLADEQSQIEEKMDEIREKVQLQDKEIQKLQKSLKEAEQILSSAIFQARQKMESIMQANKRPISSEELIKYAHRISAANAICAPENWCIGDVRRPYPTDVEMRNGFLGKSELNIMNGSSLPYQNNITEVQRGNSSEVPTSFQNQFNWNTMGELHMSMGSVSNNSVSLETRAHKEASQDDVEVMSTDSSSSSSSDSQ